VLSYLLAVLAAVANATSSTLQRKANISEPDDVSFRPAMILDLLHRPVWLGGIGAVTAGFVLQAAALAHGELAVVEPILVLELPFTLALASVVFHRRLHRREWTAAAMMSAGLALLLLGLEPRRGAAMHVSLLGWGLGIAVSVLVVAALIARAVRRPAERAPLLGVATGATFGMTAAFMTGASEAFAQDPVSALSDWQTWAMLAAGLTGMFLLQNALQSGTLVAVQPGLTLTDPLASLLWAVLVFGEQVQGGPWLVVDVVGALLIAWGTFTLSRSPLIHDKTPEPSEGGQEVKRRRRWPATPPSSAA
jgi:drug/metabolite transporter (DMT)-like permease